MHLSAPPSPCPEEHPFAPFVRTLGRGRRGARSLEREEARTALGMILDGEADPLQTGAFLMLLRVKEETAEEIAGFVQAARERAQLPECPITVDLDWPTYAGKRQQPPWYLLSALLLAAHGHRVLMHGCEPHARNRLFAAPGAAGARHRARARLAGGGRGAGCAPFRVRTARAVQPGPAGAAEPAPPVRPALAGEHLRASHEPAGRARHDAEPAAPGLCRAARGRGTAARAAARADPARRGRRMRIAAQCRQPLHPARGRRGTRDRFHAPAGRTRRRRHRAGRDTAARAVERPRRGRLRGSRGDRHGSGRAAGAR